METQTIINLAFSTISLGIGWFAREMWAAVKELKADLSKLREELPKTYVTRDDFKDDMKDVKEMLNKIFDRLENKMDK